MKELQKPYFMEPSLPLRVKKYMQTNKYVDVEDMTEYLINTYKEFKLKKKKQFVKSVSKAYKWQCYVDKMNKYPTEEDDKEDLEVLEIDSDEASNIVKVPKKKSSYEFSIDAMYTPSLKSSNGIDSPTPKHESKLLKSSKKRRKGADSAELPEIEMLKKKRKKFETSVPECSLEDMKGINSLCTDAYLLSLNLTEDTLKAASPKSVLLSGPQGSGKSTFAMGLAGDMGATLMRVPVNELLGAVGPEAETLVKELFKEALTLGPCVVLLENLDCLSSRDHGSVKGVDRKVVDQLQDSLSQLETKFSSERILVVAETRSPQNMDLSLRTRFKMDLFMPVLDKDARLAVLKTLDPDLKPEFDMEEIALRTTSYVGGDLKELVEKGKRVAWERLIKENLDQRLFKEPKPKQFIARYSLFSKGRTLDVEPQDLLAALSMVTPTLKKEGFPSVPDTTWEDVGGLDDIKEELSEKILVPMKYGELHEKFRAKKPNGILLWGPPGCGKTLLAKAVANHAGVNLYAVMGPELLNMYQGESERAIREVFKRAGSVAPCVIFFDEFDCLCPRRSASADSGSKMTIVNTLLVEMNGFNQRKDVYVMAATNRPDMVDPAVLRPGRFDTSLFVGLPDPKGRVAVLNACTRNGTEPRLASDVDLKEICGWCENFSGADCAQLVYMASKGAIAEEIEQGCVLNQTEKVGTLYKRHFLAALKRVSPSVAPEEQKKYLRMKTKFENWRKNGKEIVLEEEMDSVMS